MHMSESLKTFGNYELISCSVVVRVQMLAELEEIISYKGHADEPDRQATQRRTWQKR